jgi:hypothetical protein
MFALILKANPYHDENGRFSKSTGAHNVVEANLKSTASVVASIKKRLSPAEIATIAKYEADIAGKKTSAEMFKTADGSWTPERVKLHKAIVADFMKDAAKYKAKPGEKPTLITLGGRGGSGKSKLTDGTLDVIDASKYKTLDPDEIKKKLPGYNGTNAALYHAESGHISDLLLTTAIAKKINLIQDVTMRSEKTIKQSLEWAKNRGYNLEGHYMHLSREEAGFRAAKRGLKPTDPRYVPLDIVAGNTHNERNFNVLKPYFSKWSIHSNDVAQGQKPVLHSKSKD